MNQKVYCLFISERIYGRGKQEKVLRKVYMYMYMYKYRHKCIQSHEIESPNNEDIAVPESL